MSDIPTPTIEQINAFEAAPSLVISALSRLSESQLCAVPGSGEESLKGVRYDG